MTSQEAIAKAALAYLPAHLKQAIQYLDHSPSSAEQLAEGVGVTAETSRRWIKVLRKLGVIYICEYVYPEGQGGVTKIWALGERRNVRPRDKLTPAERIRAYKARKKVVTLGVFGL
jgi:predicted ArsR family transcriptional regulator